MRSITPDTDEMDMLPNPDLVPCFQAGSRLALARDGDLELRIVRRKLPHRLEQHVMALLGASADR